MNRRSFLKKLGVLAGLGLVVPKALSAQEEGVDALIPYNDTVLLDQRRNRDNGDRTRIITGGKIYGKVRFNNKDFGVVAVKSRV